MRASRGKTWGQLGALALVVCGALTVVASFGIDFLFGRSQVEGSMGVIGLLASAAGGLIFRQINRRINHAHDMLVGEGIAVVSVAGAVQEFIRQWLYYFSGVRIDRASTLFFLGAWAATGVVWFLTRWRKFDDLDDR